MAAPLLRYNPGADARRIMRAALGTGNASLVGMNVTPALAPIGTKIGDVDLFRRASL